MKRLIFLLAFVFAGLVLYGQVPANVTDNVYAPITDINTVGGGFAGGDSRAAAYTKINTAFAILDTLYSHYVIGNVTDGAPTDAQIDTILQVSPSAVQGHRYFILDTLGTEQMYHVISTGTGWAVDSMAIAQ